MTGISELCTYHAALKNADMLDVPGKDQIVR